VGSLVIGFFATLTGPDGRVLVAPDARQFMMVGLCGGYTTFSSFSLQTLNLVRDGDMLGAGGNIVGSVVLCLVAVWLGHIAAATINQTIQATMAAPQRNPGTGDRTAKSLWRGQIARALYPRVALSASIAIPAVSAGGLRNSVAARPNKTVSNYRQLPGGPVGETRPPYTRLVGWRASHAVSRR